MKPTPEIVQALTNLRVNSDFEVVLSFLASQREQARDDCETFVEGPKLWRQQGRATFVRDFFVLNEEAPKHLDKFKQSKLK